MGFSLDRVVPWGRSFDEYVAMFDLSATDLDSHLLGCGDGPSAFNADVTARGGDIVSVDPIYRFTTLQLRQRIAETRQLVLQQLRQNQADYVWDSIPSVAALDQLRVAAMEVFLRDYDRGLVEGRYIAGELPHLPLGDRTFDLALSSHFLFLYSAQLDEDFHHAALSEMLHLAKEVRVFPLLTLDGQMSPWLAPICRHFAEAGFEVRRQRVDYEFQRGANEMLIIRHAQC